MLKIIAVRFAKGLLATMGASGVAYLLAILPQLTMLNAIEISVASGILLAAEKALQGYKPQ